MSDYKSTVGSRVATPARILVVGDSQVGKSLLVHLVCTSANTGKASMPVDRLESTIGFAVDACVWRVFGAVGAELPLPSVIEFIEVGGNRNFSQAARKVCYCTPDSSRTGAAAPQRRIDGVIFVYSSDNGGSAVALDEWLRELESCDVLKGGAPFLVLGTTMLALPTMGAHGSSGIPQRPSRREGALTPMWALWGALEQLLYVCMGFVLFGLSQSVAPFRRRPTAKQALAALENHGQCFASVDLPLSTPADFSSHREDVDAFFGTILRRRFACADGC